MLSSWSSALASGVGAAVARLSRVCRCARRVRELFSFLAAGSLSAALRCWQARAASIFSSAWRRAVAITTASGAVFRSR